MAESSREDKGDVLRILVATDCHLGYMEKDEIRRHDSFQAFEEICSIAENKEVDFILLGGDLFHENKPSRSTLVKAIETLRGHCLNDKPVQFQVVSDQTVNFANSFGHVNYEDPHFNVGLPVFTIHGNHDDPAGVDNLSAVDILSACNLVNYFGKMVLEGAGVGQITLCPILIKKGSTSVALYGLGNIRDERLNRMFQTPHAVQWMRPEAQEGCQVSDWFNMLVLHQNRVKANPKNAINEHFLPRFLDFIVWGHEHECLVDPQEIPGMGFHITQPGSSIATSLIDGESKPKHVLLLEIKGNQYRPTKIPLNSVRPFEYTEVVLKDEPGIDANDQNSILEHLDNVVRSLINKCNEKTVTQKELKLPLVRIKVDYSGFMTINPQRFGQKYVGKVANPQDILIFSKASRKIRSEVDKIDDSERLRPEELNQQNIEALVAESNLKMEILPVNDLDVALHDFVNKDDKMAFYSCLQHNLEETRNKIARDSDVQKFEEEDVIVKVGECLEYLYRKIKFNPLYEERVKVKANPKNAINEHFLPRFLDFIVWGHEHECLVDPQEIPGMGFHITQPGSSIATSLIDGESKPKHVLLLEIKGNQYRPTKIPLNSVRPFEYTEVVLKDEPGIDANDQNSILEHLDNVVRSLINKCNEKTVTQKELKLPLVRIKVDYSGFMTINPQRFGQKYVGKVANPQDILIFSKASRKIRSEVDKIDDSERLRPEELNQQNIEALVAESNLKMEILPVNDLDVALHDFVNKDDKMAFYSCLQHNLEETRNKIARDSDVQKFEEEDVIVKVGECLEERLKERSSRPKDTQQFTFSGQSSELNIRSSTVGSAASFSDDEDATMFRKSSKEGKKEMSPSFRSSRDVSEVSKTTARGRGRGRGRVSSTLKQTTLDAAMTSRHSQRSASVAASASVQNLDDDEDGVDSDSHDETEKFEVKDVDDGSDDARPLQGKGRKRAAAKGRARESTTTSKRGRKSDNTSSSLQRLLITKDDDDDDDDMMKKLSKSQTRVTRNYGALRR